MFGTVGTVLASTHLWLVISCALLTLISLFYTILNAKAKGRLQDLQLEHERMLLCLDCLKNGVNGQCSIPPDRRPRNCPRKNDKV